MKVSIFDSRREKGNAPELDKVIGHRVRDAWVIDGELWVHFESRQLMMVWYVDANGIDAVAIKLGHEIDGKPIDWSRVEEVAEPEPHAKGLRGRKLTGMRNGVLEFGGVGVVIKRDTITWLRKVQ